MTKLGKELIQAAYEARDIARGTTDIDALIERLRFWANNPKDVMEMAFHCEQAADALAKLRDDASHFEEIVKGYHKEMFKAQAEIAKLREHCCCLHDDLAECREALEAVVADILEYERINNLAPNPGRKFCWDSVAKAKATLGEKL